MTDAIEKKHADNLARILDMFSDKAIPAQSAALRDEINREIADLPETDLKGVLRMIRVWKGLKND